MSEVTHSTSSKPAATSSETRLQRRLGRLRQALHERPGEGIISALEEVSSAAEQVLTEHAGLADELLFAYEQLGAVFDITRRLPGVSGESEVLDLFLDSLGRSFSDGATPGVCRGYAGAFPRGCGGTAARCPLVILFRCVRVFFAGGRVRARVRVCTGTHRRAGHTGRKAGQFDSRLA